MLLRIRWFLYGVVASVGALAYAAARARRARDRLTAGGLARGGAYGVADLLEALATRIRPAAAGSPHSR